MHDCFWQREESAFLSFALTASLRNWAQDPKTEAAVSAQATSAYYAVNAKSISDCQVVWAAKLTARLVQGGYPIPQPRRVRPLISDLLID